MLELNNTIIAMLITFCNITCRYIQLIERAGTRKLRRSKLETHVAILSVLAIRGPLKLTHIMYKANINCSVLTEHLNFLIKQKLVEERIVKKSRVVFAITPRGSTVLKYFRELTQALPIIEENRVPMLY